MYGSDVCMDQMYVCLYACMRERGESDMSRLIEISISSFASLPRCCCCCCSIIVSGISLTSAAMSNQEEQQRNLDKLSDYAEGDGRVDEAKASQVETHRDTSTT